MITINDSYVSLESIEDLYISEEYLCNFALYYTDGKLSTSLISRGSYPVYTNIHKNHISCIDFQNIILENISKYNEKFIQGYKFNVKELLGSEQDLYSKINNLFYYIEEYSISELLTEVDFFRDNLTEILSYSISIIQNNPTTNFFMYNKLSKLSSILEIIEGNKSIGFFNYNSYEFFSKMDVLNYLKYDIDKYINFKLFISDKNIYEMVYFDRPLLEIKKSINSKNKETATSIKDLYEKNKTIDCFRDQYFSEIIYDTLYGNNGNITMNDLYHLSELERIYNIFSKELYKNTIINCDFEIKDVPQNIQYRLSSVIKKDLKIPIYVKLLNIFKNKKP